MAVVSVAKTVSPGKRLLAGFSVSAVVPVPVRAAPSDRSPPWLPWATNEPTGAAGGHGQGHQGLPDVAAQAASLALEPVHQDGDRGRRADRGQGGRR